jgi:hypothetical protein
MYQQVYTRDNRDVDLATAQTVECLSDRLP